MLSLCCVSGFSLVAASRARLRWGGWASHCDASLIEEQGLWGTWASVVAARELSHWGCWLLVTGSVEVAHGLCCSTTCGIFLDQGLNPCLLHWQVGSLPLSHREAPVSCKCVFPLSFFWDPCPTGSSAEARGSMGSVHSFQSQTEIRTVSDVLPVPMPAVVSLILLRCSFGFKSLCSSQLITAPPCCGASPQGRQGSQEPEVFTGE